MIDQLIDKIIQNPLFLKLKDVVENNAYHTHEDVYSHLIKTKDIAQREIKGDFITNPEAKKLFLEFVNEDFHGMKRQDLIVIIALLHDIGKILPILVTNSEGKTFCPGHEYQGSKIVGKLLKDLPLSEEIIPYISNVIRLHDTFGEGYMAAKKGWPFDALMADIQSRAEGLHKEAMFNVYCDCFTAEPFQYAKAMIVKLFNHPKLYEKREYTI